MSYSNKTVFEKVKEMTPKEFSDFLAMVYEKGWVDGNTDADEYKFISDETPTMLWYTFLHTITEAAGVAR